MQAGDAPAGLRDVMQIGRQLFAVARVFAGTQQALLLDEAVEIGRSHGPGVALVGDEGMQDADGVSFVAVDQFDAAEHRGRVGKARDFGQEPPGLDLGLIPDFSVRSDLDDIVVIHLRGASACSLSIVRMRSGS